MKGRISRGPAVCSNLTRAASDARSQLAICAPPLCALRYDLSGSVRAPHPAAAHLHPLVEVLADDVILLQHVQPQRLAREQRQERLAQRLVLRPRHEGDVGLAQNPLSYAYVNKKAHS